MPRNISKDLLQREERKKLILEAATRIFARKGMLTKITDIAAEAGFSHGHMYNYFSSKEEIVNTIINQSQEHYENQLLLVRDLATSGFNKLRFIVEKYGSSAEVADIYLVILQAQSSDLLSNEDKKAIQQRARENLLLLVEIIEQGQREGDVMQGNSMQLGTLLVTIMQNLILFEIRGFEAANAETVELVLDMIRGPKEKYTGM